MTHWFPIQNPKSKIKHHKHSCSGQAMLELAVFGSLLLLVLGALVNYGLNAEFSQHATMETFRQALVDAAKSPLNGQPAAVSHLRIQNRHIPNPSHPFGLGSAIPVAAQAGVTRNFQMQEIGTTVAELPRLQMTIQGAPFDCPSDGVGCATAGFRVEQDPPPGSLKGYLEVYGPTHVCTKPSCGG